MRLPCRVNFLCRFDALLIGLNRWGTSVGRFIRDQPDFCLANHDMGRVYGAYGAHISLLEFIQNYSDSFMLC